ncbi:M3 family metallopeptidase [Lamprobacter modestohalophilus]|uniref:M3 family metallopeptidase n=1 Tax=Lamprobacter modestohalophilus TaxID=1064514 RepID=UPI002ADEF168|nr:M3 family metallopeptidase [Lamprobacter modestohalophilus]MEA1051099.1 M3 family metallopeptidase [Lamprobacter modestohalophilus]
MPNPLLNDLPHPTFNAIRPEHVEPAIEQCISNGRRLVQSLTADTTTATWDSFVQPIEEEDDRLARAWSPISHLNAVMSSDELRVAYNACLPKLSEYATEVGHNESLYCGYKQVLETDDLDPAQRKMLSNALRDMHLAGVDLPPESKARFKEINRELSLLSAKYEENLLDATNAWHKHLATLDPLDGLPESAIGLAKHMAEERDMEGWVLTLDLPSYLPVMKYAHNRELRRELYEAYATRASDQGPNAGRWDNTEVIEALLALRHEQAKLLGFDNFAEVSLEPKMARSTTEVMAFLEDLAQRSAPQARHEMDSLQAFARANGGPEQLEAWDVSYWSERLRQSQYAISDEELKPYFALKRVLQGMFQIAEHLFDVHIKPEPGEADVWHPDVSFYQITNGDSELIAQFYLDPFARQKKRGGAWMDVCTNRLISKHRHQLPIAYLICNFTPAVNGQPTLLTHDEVQTLFHEFGHGLHHMLTRVDYPAVAGINGVPWDAVELPSQFLENWCWEREALDLFATHWETGQQLPEALYQRMRSARNFQSAMQTVRQLEFALFDFRLHLEYAPETGSRFPEILAEVRSKLSPIQPPAFNRFAHGFSHIFAGGYAAGYYSYKWAELLAADAFSLFEECGILDVQSGRAFREQILERGGSADPMELYVGFRGREPTIEALLRHTGIVCAENQHDADLTS